MFDVNRLIFVQEQQQLAARIQAEEDRKRELETEKSRKQQQLLESIEQARSAFMSFVLFARIY